MVDAELLSQICVSAHLLEFPARLLVTCKFSLLYTLFFPPFSFFRIAFKFNTGFMIDLRKSSCYFLLLQVADALGFFPHCLLFAIKAHSYESLLSPDLPVERV